MIPAFFYFKIIIFISHCLIMKKYRDICAQCKFLGQDNRGFICKQSNFPTDLKGSCDLFVYNEPKKKKKSRHILPITFLVIAVFSTIIIINKQHQQRKDQARNAEMFSELIELNTNKTISYKKSVKLNDTLGYLHLKNIFQTNLIKVSNKRFSRTIQMNLNAISTFAKNKDSVYLTNILLMNKSNQGVFDSIKQEGFMVHIYKNRHFFPQDKIKH